ncbi:hypothetical protein [Paraburkholderia domus]|jgi:hypothetical protein|uniref:hypothetical protein n=1 Tax=Paraburkholderia domus TaxID=2793075 RepID=UPI001911A3CB|nr:hypothetical protein [Paraburkholderia domus]MBK5049525.1 hypothetical protein [Burkholderia sp. R-70006]MBK5061912.1 hypothetical protein [Burkholderia sp. R-70199]MBK5087165.1 hypothetical protein [Burkholderia sp. R-69927]MBK5123520.1 hypothetical protein [Burkholderia sp. R-69980]MBK5166752.1 hypothetical protein [Burkholderia sp. R-70211]MCI0148310.1 hypothetical protein [Paraburkholderia sediminicola]
MGKARFPINDNVISRAIERDTPTPSVLGVGVVERAKDIEPRGLLTVWEAEFNPAALR